MNREHLRVLVVFSLLIMIGFYHLSCMATPILGHFNILLSKRTFTATYTMTATIAAENDDGEIYTVSWYPNGESSAHDVYAGHYMTVPVWAYMRFKVSQTIPAGATITNTVLSIQGGGDYHWTTYGSYLLVGAENTSNATQVTSANDAPGGSNGRTIIAQTKWPANGTLTWNAGSLNVSNNLSSIIQPIVNLGGLSQNSYIQLWLFTDTPVGQDGPEVMLWDYGSGSHNTSLKIDWSY